MKFTIPSIIKASCLVVFFSFTITEASTVSIGTVDDVVIGQEKKIPVSVDSIASEISSFDLTIAYQSNKASIIRVNPGEIFDSCGWEYFNYRLISPDTAVTYYPNYAVKLVNIVGQASLYSAPAAACQLNSATLAEFDIVISRQVFDNTYDRIWFNFFWFDCDDNVLISLSGDTTYIASELSINLPSVGTIPELQYPFPGFGLPDESCTGLRNGIFQSELNFVNSGAYWRWWIVDGCTHEGGDLNLNNIRYEIADIVLFVNYFVYGVSVFQISQAGQIYTSDVNCDGLTLDLRDLYMMLRIANGDFWFTFYKQPTNVPPEAKLLYSSDGKQDQVDISFDEDVSLLYLKLTSSSNKQLSTSDFVFEQSGAKFGQIGDTITMLLVDLDGGNVLESGIHSILLYFGESDLNIEGTLVDKYGREVLFKLENTSLPDSPELHQNYPNPFNPTTTIEFSLPTYSDWSIELYNVAGQLVKQFAGASVGRQKIEWDGTNLDGTTVSSGVYFYKLITQDETSSRKMLLLK